MDEKVAQLINRVKDYLINIYGKKVRRVILYGSHVRGDATKDSDIDVLVLIDESLNPFEVRKSLSDFLLDILLENGELISVIALPEHFFKTHNYPFMLNVKKNGISL
jgi:predicted nucleotidyltransferase